MSKTTTIRIDAARYADHDDCLSAAAADYAAAHDLAGWDLDPRWEDDQRDAILLTVPADDEGAGYLTLTDEGAAHVALFAYSVIERGRDARPFYDDAERAANNALPGDDLVFEISAHDAEDGKPHTLNMPRGWFVRK